MASVLAHETNSSRPSGSCLGSVQELCHCFHDGVAHLQVSSSTVTRTTRQISMHTYMHRRTNVLGKRSFTSLYFCLITSCLLCLLILPCWEQTVLEVNTTWVNIVEQNCNEEKNGTFAIAHFWVYSSATLWAFLVIKPHKGNGWVLSNKFFWPSSRVFA